MAKKQSVAWTICYALNDERYEDGFLTATWFAYGKTKEEAKKRFLADFNGHREDFFDANENTEIQIVNVIKGFTC